MHHTRRTFNSAQIYRHSFSFPLYSSIDDNFVMVRIKQRTCVKSSKTASATLHVTFTHTNMCKYELHKQTCCIPARADFGIFYCRKKHATLNACIHIHTQCITHTQSYTFSKSKRQTACEHTRWSIFGNFMIVFIYIYFYIHEFLSFYFCIVVVAMIIFVTRKNIAIYV